MSYQHAAAALLEIQRASTHDPATATRRFMDGLLLDLANAHEVVLPDGTQPWPTYERAPDARPEALMAPLRSLEWYEHADVSMGWLDSQPGQSPRTDIGTPFAILGVLIELGSTARIRVPHGALSGLRDAFIRQMATDQVGARRIRDALAFYQEQLVLFVTIDGPGYQVPELVALGPSRRGDGDGEARAKLDLRTVYVPLNDLATQPKVEAQDFDNKLVGMLGDLLHPKEDDPDAWKDAFAHDLKTLTQARNLFRQKLKKSLGALMQLLEQTRDEEAAPGQLLALRDAASLLAYRTMFLLELERRGRLYRAGAPALSVGGKSSRQPLQEVFAYLHDSSSPAPGAAFVRLMETSRSVRGDTPSDALLISGPSIFSNLPNDAFDPQVEDWLDSADALAAAAQSDEGADPELLARWDVALGATGSVMLGHLDDEFSAELNLIGGAASRHRHRVLGNVYEQILAMTPARDKTGLVSLSVSKKGKKVASEKDERAALGAHYTPVTLVNEVVRPVFAARFARLWSEAGEERDAYREGLERLRVIDPAMGSAHFLTVAALELARELAWVELRKQPRFVELEDWSEPLLHQNPIGPDEADDAQGLERYIDAEDAAAFEQAVQRALPGVIQRSIFGVDINPLAVELAKLSLWLFEVVEHSDVGDAADTPELSFLDANLQCGDSVIGLDLKEVAAVLDGARPPSQNFELFGAQHETLDQRLSQIRALEAKLRAAGAEGEAGPNAYQRRRALHEEIRALVSGLDWIFDLALVLKMHGYSAHAGAKATRAVYQLLYGDAPSGSAKQQRAAVETALTGLLDAPFEATPERDALIERLAEFFRNQDPAHPLRPFHWPLRFTAARLDGGFDAIVANPPFIGDRNLRARIGDAHTDFLADHYTRGKLSEYAGYFLHRFAQEVGASGVIGTLSTNSIAQASNREYVLYPLLNAPWRASERRLRLTRSVRSRVWPGEAKVHYAMLHLEPVDAVPVVSPRSVEPQHPSEVESTTAAQPADSVGVMRSEQIVVQDRISSYLDAYPDAMLEALPAYASDTLSQGFILRGNFSIHRQPGQSLTDAIAAIPEPEPDALAAYYNAQDVQHHAVPQASDIVIDFFQPLADAKILAQPTDQQLAWLALHYPTLFAYLQERSPHRMDHPCAHEQRSGLRSATAIDRAHSQSWFLFGSPRRGLRRAWKGRRHVYAFPRVTKIWSPTPLPRTDASTGLRICPTEATFIAPTDSLAWFGVVQSFIFESLVRRQCSTLETRLRFTPTDVFPFFPYPWASRFDAKAGKLISEPPADDALGGALADVARIAAELLAHREEVLKDPAGHGISKPGGQWGPTKLYNRYDDERIDDASLPAIAALRRLHAELLCAVLRAYAWPDLAEQAKREHWIFDRPWIDQSQRFVPPMTVRDAIYERIAALNAQRFEEEIAILLPLAKPALPKRAGSAKKLRQALAERHVEVSDNVAATLLERLMRAR